MAARRGAAAVWATEQDDASARSLCVAEEVDDVDSDSVMRALVMRMEEGGLESGTGSGGVARRPWRRCEASHHSTLSTVL